MVTNHVTLVGLLNAKNYDAGEDVIIQLVGCLEDSLQSNDFFKAKLYTRCIADLLNAAVTQAASLLAMFHGFLAVVSEADAPQWRRDAYAGLVLHALPWVGRRLQERDGEGLEAIMETIAGYMGYVTVPPQSCAWRLQSVGAYLVLAPLSTRSLAGGFFTPR